MGKVQKTPLRSDLAIAAVSWAIVLAVLAGGAVSNGRLMIYAGAALIPSAMLCWLVLLWGARADRTYLNLDFWQAYSDEPDPWARVQAHFDSFRFLVPRNKLIFYTLAAFSLWGVAAIYVLKVSVGDMGHIPNLWVYGSIILACCGTSFVTEYSRQTSYLKLIKAQPFAQQFMRASVLLGLAAISLLFLVDDSIRPDGLLLAPALAVVLLSNTAFQLFGNAFGQIRNAVRDEMLVTLSKNEEEQGR